MFNNYGRYFMLGFPFQNELVNLESKLAGLENDLFTNQKTIEKIRDTVKELRQQQVIIKEESKAIRSKGKSPVNKTFASVAKVDLQFPSVKPSQCDIRMDDVYDKIAFKNVDGGVWKQGWDVQYNRQNVVKPENKLRVIVMPHSHNDPGNFNFFMTCISSLINLRRIKLGKQCICISFSI